MIITRILLRNWRNFLEVNVPLGDRVLIVGPNASGKSNFLDVFRFLRDISKNGLQKAIESRGGLSKIRCLSARTNPAIHIEVHFAEINSQNTLWRYSLAIKQRKGGRNEPFIEKEEVWKSNKLILERPNTDDKKDFLLICCFIISKSLKKGFSIFYFSK